MTTKMPRWLEDKRNQLSDLNTILCLDVGSFPRGFNACFDIVVPELLDALKSVAPSWLPEAVREKRRKVLEKYGGRTE